MLEEVLAQLPAGDVLDVFIGIHWTAVVVAVEGARRCGLASTLTLPHAEHGTPDVAAAGSLHRCDATTLAREVLSDAATMVSVGMATINALLTPPPEKTFERNAGELLAELGAGKTVALVGSFPFARALREQVGQLFVLDEMPGDGEYPPEAAATLLPQAEVVAITGMTLLNRSLERLLALRRPDATVLILGPSTPLSPVLFAYGVDILSGAVVQDVDAVLRLVSQGATFRQIRRSGSVRLVNRQRARDPGEPVAGILRGQ